VARIVKGGLIQMANPINDESVPVNKISDAMIEKHIPMIEEAGKKGVQILCLQEIFNGPYFCPGQDKRWYGVAESCPGPITDLMSEYCKKYNMVMVVPIYERAMAGVYYNTAAVIDADGTYLGKYRKNHIPQTSGFWEKFFFKPGNLGYPVFQTAYGKVGVYIVTTATSLKVRDYWVSMERKSYSIHQQPWLDFPSTSGRWSNPPTLWPTVISWDVSTELAPNHHGILVSFMAQATLLDPAENSWLRVPKMMMN